MPSIFGLGLQFALGVEPFQVRDLSPCVVRGVSVLECVGVCWSVLECVGVCCSVLQFAEGRAARAHSVTFAFIRMVTMARDLKPKPLGFYD